MNSSMPRRLILLVLFSVSWGGLLYAAPPCDTLLPATTKGFLSVPDLDELQAQWSTTSLGRLANDPVMQPFAEDLEQQLDEKLSQIGVRLNISWSDVEDVYGGEVCVAAIQPGGDPAAHATALLVDVTDHLEQAQALLEKVSRNLLEKGGRRGVQRVEGVEIVVFALPPKEEGLRIERAYYYIHQNMLVATDHEAVALEILSHFTPSGSGTLAQLPAYSHIMQTCQQAAGDLQPHIRWFIVPFGYAEVLRAAAQRPRQRGTDILKVLANQGFAAIDGVGGFVTVGLDDFDIVHRTKVYAPTEQAQPVTPGPNFELAARMLAFPNFQEPKAALPHPWISADIATYLTFRWKVREAFEHSKTLVNELADAGEDDIFEDVLAGIREDELGPQVDLRADLVAHLGDRITVVSDHKLPITPESERLLMAIEVANPNAVAATVNKAMEREPDAEKRQFGEIVIWEILPRQAEDVPELKIDGPAGFGAPFGQPQQPIEEEEGPTLPHMAIAVAKNHLIIASHVDFVVEVLTNKEQEQPLGQGESFTRVFSALQKLGMQAPSFLYYSRTDKAYRPTYELLRQGKMPESETLLGRLLNRLLAPEEEGVLRAQRIEGSKLPPFEQVQHHFGASGLYVETMPDGWFIVGALLATENAGQ